MFTFSHEARPFMFYTLMCIEGSTDPPVRQLWRIPLTGGQLMLSIKTNLYQYFVLHS